MPLAPSHVQLLAEVRSRILNLLLSDKDLVDTLMERPRHESSAEADAHRQQVEEIKQTLPLLHAADIADLLEALPADERLALWRLVGNDRRGHVLLEVSENVWESLIEEMSDRDLLRAIKPLDIDEQAWLAKYLSRDLTGRLLTSLDPALRSNVLEVMDFDRDRVGRIMDFKLVTVRADVTLATVQRFLRRKNLFPTAPISCLSPIRTICCWASCR